MMAAYVDPVSTEPRPKKAKVEAAPVASDGGEQADAEKRPWN